MVVRSVAAATEFRVAIVVAAAVIMMLIITINHPRSRIIVVSRTVIVIIIAIIIAIIMTVVVVIIMAISFIRPACFKEAARYNIIYIGLNFDCLLTAIQSLESLASLGFNYFIA